MECFGPVIQPHAPLLDGLLLGGLSAVLMGLSKTGLPGVLIPFDAHPLRRRERPELQGARVLVEILALRVVRRLVRHRRDR